MELKLTNYLKGLLKFVRLNRTFMELKRIRYSLEFIRNSSLNRTFMELKHSIKTLNVHYQDVLIVPLWN